MGSCTIRAAMNSARLPSPRFLSPAPPPSPPPPPPSEHHPSPPLRHPRPFPPRLNIPVPVLSQ
eukprot:9479510-Pyramimonas_sp.AAC.1